ncbi:MAG: sigma-70 family RNA polymerase sigma factor [Thermoanaerobaculia bacterium]
MTSLGIASDEALGSKPARELPLAERVDGGELTLFYNRVGPRLWGFLLAQTGDSTVADDLTQEAFTRVLASRFSPESDEHLTRYLFRTAIHLVQDRGRAAKRRPLPLEQAPEPACGPPAGGGGLRRDLLRALAELKPRDRQLVWLAHVEELGHAEIAEITGLHAASIRVLLFRARRRLAKRLGGPGPS